jgi:hypothetical protein
MLATHVVAKATDARAFHPGAAELDCSAEDGDTTDSNAGVIVVAAIALLIA